MSHEVRIIGPHEGQPHTHTFILLHGKECNSRDFAVEFFDSQASEPTEGPRTLLDLFPTIKWVLPQGPLIRHVRSEIMARWFDIESVKNPNENLEIQENALRSSVEFILEVIKSEEAMVPRSKIFLGGISQGFATAMAAFFADGQGFAGLVGLSSWMPLAGSVPNTSEGDTDAAFRCLQERYFGHESAPVSPHAIKKTPILLEHAWDDHVVPVGNGRQLREVLRQRLGPDAPIEWHEYVDGGHGVNEPQGVDDMVDFLRRHMA